MAETDREDKTEDASPERLEQMAREGQISMARDLVSFMGFALGALALSVTARATLSSLVTAVDRAITNGARGAPVGADLASVATPVVVTIFAVTAAAGAGGALTTLAQTGARVWTEKLAPDPSRLFSMERLTKVISREFFVDFFLSVVKTMAIVSAGYLAVRGDLSSLARLQWSDLGGHLLVLGGLALRAGMGALGAIGLLAVVDALLQRHRFLEKARMTKEEVRRERKDAEGDPLIKRQRRVKHREIMQGRVQDEVPRADAIIVNPTHIAIAIRYRRDEGGAPRVIAKGKGDKAERIRELARAHGIHIVQDVPLARLLYRKVKVGAAIPEQSYRAVAAILSFVYRTRRRRP